MTSVSRAVRQPGLLLTWFGLVSLICGLALPETKNRELHVPDAVKYALSPGIPYLMAAELCMATRR